MTNGSATHHFLGGERIAFCRRPPIVDGKVGSALVPFITFTISLIIIVVVVIVIDAVVVIVETAAVPRATTGIRVIIPVRAAAGRVITSSKIAAFASMLETTAGRTVEDVTAALTEFARSVLEAPLSR